MFLLCTFQKKLRKTAMVENVIEKDPNFEHKRAEGMD
jgi:hypothetical protein